jgi:hypothetical protein
MSTQMDMKRRSLDSNASSTNQFRRGSQMKILRESRVGLGIIQEQEDINTLKRTLSWPGHRGSIVQQSEIMDIAIFSTYLLKKNRGLQRKGLSKSGIYRVHIVSDW